ncbi:hypothetical protein ACFSQ7_45935 [Paenibacillus rhizoplanae]
MDADPVTADLRRGLHLRQKVRPMYIDLRERLSQLNTTTQENISGNRVVKAFCP